VGLVRQLAWTERYLEALAAYQARVKDEGEGAGGTPSETPSETPSGATGETSFGGQDEVGFRRPIPDQYKTDFTQPTEYPRSFVDQVMSALNFGGGYKFIAKEVEDFLKRAFGRGESQSGSAGRLPGRLDFTNEGITSKVREQMNVRATAQLRAQDLLTAQEEINLNDPAHVAALLRAYQAEMETLPQADTQLVHQIPGEPVYLERPPSEDQVVSVGGGPPIHQLSRIYASRIEGQDDLNAAARNAAVGGLDVLLLDTGGGVFLRQVNKPLEDGVVEDGVATGTSPNVFTRIFRWVAKSFGAAYVPPNNRLE
jgi:hypothetical protein